MDLAHSRYCHDMLEKAKRNFKNSPMKNSAKSFNTSKRMVLMHLKYSKDDVYFAERRSQKQTSEVLAKDPMALKNVQHMTEVIKSCMPCVWTPIGVKKMINATNVYDLLHLTALEPDRALESLMRPAPQFDFISTSEVPTISHTSGLKEMVLCNIADPPCRLPSTDAASSPIESSNIEVSATKEGPTPMDQTPTELMSPIRSMDADQQNASETSDIEMTSPRTADGPDSPIPFHTPEVANYVVNKYSKPTVEITFEPATKKKQMHEDERPKAVCKRSMQAESHKLSMDGEFVPAIKKQLTTKNDSRTPEEKSDFLRMFSLCPPSVADYITKTVKERSFRQSQCPYLGCSPLVYKDKKSRKSRRSANSSLDTSLILHTRRTRVEKVYKDYV